jgi:hypothetical protein
MNAPPVREVTSHKLNFLNDAISIASGDVPEGLAPRVYVMTVDEKLPGVTLDAEDPLQAVIIRFQDGNPKFKITGYTNEALLAIVADRLTCFQNGPFKSRENAIALTKIEEAMLWLMKRTLGREARGVEGEKVP